MDNFDSAVQYVLRNEGGFVDNPKDPGGATNFGITLRTLSAWRKTTCTVDDVKTMKVDEARLIYKAKYWLDIELDQILDCEIATALLDVAVNRGKNTSVKYAQLIVGCKPDCMMGPGTLQKINAYDPNQFIQELSKSVKDGYADLLTRLPGLSIFKGGWFARADKLLTLQVT